MNRETLRTFFTPHRRAHRRLHAALGTGTRTVLLLAAASFLTDISSEMTLKLLPIFLTGTLGASVATVGLIEGIGESTASLTKLLGGRVSDRLPRRLPLVIAGYSLSAVTKPLFALVSTAAPVGALRFGDRLGKGVREAPRDALIADAVPGERRGLAYGFHRAADTAGALIGVLLVALILVLAGGGGDRLARGDFQLVVLIAAAPAFLALLMLARVRERAVRERRTAPRGRMFALPRSTPERRFLLVAFLIALGDSGDAFVILRLIDGGASVVQVFLLLGLMNVTYAALAMPAGMVSDKVGRKGVLVAGYGALALLYLGFAGTNDLGLLAALTAGYGAYHGLTVGIARAFVADLAPATARGGSFGWFHMVMGLAALPAGVTAGLLWDAEGPGAAFLFSAACVAAAAVALMSVRAGVSRAGGSAH